VVSECAEIAVREIGDVVAELDDQGFVESELPRTWLDRFFVAAGASEIGGGIAGQGACQQKR